MKRKAKKMPEKIKARMAKYVAEKREHANKLAEMYMNKKDYFKPRTHLMKRKKP